MRWKDIFDLGIKMGRDNDIRNIDSPGSHNGSYADCAIITGQEDREADTVFVTVDAGPAELLLVDNLNKSGKKIDGIIMHHPTGPGAYNLTGVVDIQKYNWKRYGADRKASDRIFKKMVEEKDMEIRAGNHLAVENAAGFLDIPVICMHTAIDNIVQVFFENIINDNGPDTVQDVFNIIDSIHEVSAAGKYGAGPYIIGDGEALSGKIMVDMTGGIDPDSQIFHYLKEAGIDTLIGMHYSEDNVKAIIKNKINIVISGHMASDSIGINKYCDMLEDRGLNIIAGAGLYRYRR